MVNINTAKFWDTKHLQKRGVIKNNPMYEDKINKVLDFLRNKSGRLLDVGFGNAYLESKLIKNNTILELFGIDISKVAVFSAREKLKGNFQKASILKIPYEDHYFNYIVVLDVLEHLLPKETTFAYKELNRVLRNGGTLIVSVPINEGLEKRMKEGKNPNAHLKIYTQKSLCSELKLYGYKIFKKNILYAFKNMYKLKTLITRFIFYKSINPNLVILFAKKK